MKWCYDVHVYGHLFSGGDSPCAVAFRSRDEHDGADAGGEQSRAESVVSCAGGLQGDKGADMADSCHFRRTELRREQRSVQRDRLGAVG